MCVFLQNQPYPVQYWTSLKIRSNYTESLEPILYYDYINTLDLTIFGH